MDEITNQAAGDCFVVADRIGTRAQQDETVDEIADTDIRIVHGLPVGTGPQNRGKRYWHAWVEVTQRIVIPDEFVDANPAFANFGGEFTTELVVDRSNGHDMVLPKAVFYNVGQLDEKHVWRYTPEEATALMSSTQHYGPWVDGWEEMEEI